ncbi:MAG: hypothetical protein JNJ58_03810 [Chitinophagaceae bacterium]|nr:hypothetical protein [Chitinophagaceae bacterium]
MNRSLLQKIIASVLCVLTGGIFLFSAYSKLPTLEQFGWTIVETTPFNWTIAEWLARLLTGLEFFLGFLFIAHFRIKKIAIPVSVILLVFFTVYLLLVIKVYGSNGNCGCFGDTIPMTPLQSVYKNLAMLLVIGLIAKLQYEWNFRYGHVLTGILFLGIAGFPFLYSPPESIYLEDRKPDIMKPIPLSILYQSELNAPPEWELRKGKHIIAFMSMTCIYCRKAAKRMRIMKQKHPELPFHIVLNGDTTQLKTFFDDTKADNIHYTIFNGVEQFVTLNGGHTLPSIKWVKDTTLIRESNYINLDEDEILNWMKQP